MASCPVPCIAEALREGIILNEIPFVDPKHENFCQRNSTHLKIRFFKDNENFAPEIKYAYSSCFSS